MKKDISNTIIEVISNKEIGINEKYRIEVTITGIRDVKDFYVLFNREWEQPSIINQMKKINEEENKIIFSTEVQFNKYGNYFFFFRLRINEEQKAIKINRETNKPYIIDEMQEALYWVVLVTQKEWEIPFWATDAIFYQIVIDRFYKGKNPKGGKNPLRNYLKWGEAPLWKQNEYGKFHNNCFYEGNLNGITEKLDYIESLGTKAIYISPIFDSSSIIDKYTNRVDGYATTNLLKIDEDKGEYEDLVKLHEEANKKGMYLILDIALNHCSSNNVIFQEALNNPNSEYRDWFYFNLDGTYKYWYAFKDMPVFNQHSIGYRNHVKEMIKLFAKNVDGFRYDLGENLNQDFLKLVREETEKYGKHFYIGECWNIKPTETFGNSGFYSPTNYPFADAIYKYVLFGDGKNLSNTISEIYKIYPQKVIDTMINSLDTHDTIRAITILSSKYIRNDIGYRVWEIDREPTQWHQNGRFETYKFREFCMKMDKLTEEESKVAIERLKIACILQYFLPGNPCVYYGTEVGLTGFKDPFSRKCFPWDNINQDLLSYFRELGKFRNEYIGKNSSSPHIISDENGLYIFTRKNEIDEIFVAVNIGTIKKIKIPERFRSDDCKLFKINYDIEQQQLLQYGGIVILKHICYEERLD